MKNTRTKRDNQQWMLDLALNMRGRVQNFERDDWETPKRAHNYRMLPKMWRVCGCSPRVGVYCGGPTLSMLSAISCFVALPSIILVIF